MGVEMEEAARAAGLPCLLPEMRKWPEIQRFVINAVRECERVDETDRAKRSGMTKVLETDSSDYVDISGRGSSPLEHFAWL